jgi:F-type H+-transporting ATPase subunit delta
MSDLATLLSAELPVARVYAEAAWNLASQEGKSLEFLEEFQQFLTEVLGTDSTIEKFLASATISQSDRQRVLDQAFRGQVSDLLYHFLSTLNRHHRLELIRAIGVALQELADRDRNMVATEVRSAVPLNDAQKAEIENLVRARFQVEPRLHLSVDKTLLGGLWIRVGDTVLDRTLKTNLRKLRDVIQARNSHEIQSGRSYFDSSSGN